MKPLRPASAVPDPLSAAPLTVTHYTADWWEHVCPVIRMVGPLQEAGWRLIQGNEWEFKDGSPPAMQIFPERVDNADVVVIQRDFPVRLDDYRAVVDRARSLGKPVIYELDDLLIHLPGIHPDVDAYRKSRAAILAAVIEADAVLCSTPAIKDILQPYNPNTWVLPNYLNDHLFKSPILANHDQHPNEQKPRPLIIGYLGGHSHKPDLEMIDFVLDGLLRNYGDALILRQWGVPLSTNVKQRSNAEWLDIGLVDYAEFAEYFMHQECDIFIAPLLDNTFNRCKSWLKFLEYSWLSVPGVYSYLTPYETVVKHGKNGFLANTAEEWEKFLVQLIENPELRQQIGQAAQATVRDDWLLSKNVQHWTQTFHQALAGIKNSSNKSDLSQVARVFAGIDAENADALSSQIEETRAENLYLKSQVELLPQKDQEISRLYALYAENVDALTDRIHLIKGQADALSSQIEETRAENLYLKSQVELLPQKDQEISRLYALYYEIINSTGWQLLQLVFRIRLKVIPQGSRREHWMRKGIKLIKHTYRSSFPRLQGSSQPRSSIEFVFSKVLTGTPCPDPAVSIVIIDNAGSPLDQAGPDTEAVLDWVHLQTYHSFEVVKWDLTIAEAQEFSAGGVAVRAWQAGNSSALCNGLKGRYLCIASTDLLKWHATFLEENLCALETEKLGFTINTIANPTWPVGRLSEQMISGSPDQPLFRMVVNKRLIRPDLSLDLPIWIAEHEGKPVVAGKIISHTASSPETGTGFPLETALGDVEAAIHGHYILARTKSTNPWGRIYHSYYDPCSVMPGQADSLPYNNDQRPTILMAQTYLAIGGAERVALDMMRGLQDRLNFVVVTLEPLDPSQGTTTQAVRDITPFVYNAPDFLARPLNHPFHEYLIGKFQPATYYIGNGASWIYDVLPKIAQKHPKMRLANQVYDHQAGWINRYTSRLAALIDASIGTNSKICQAFIQRGAKPSQVFLVEHGVDIEEFDPNRYKSEDILEIKDRLNIPQGKKIVTFISRIHPQKRPMDFIELARRFSSDPAIIFLMVGDGELARTVDALLASIQLKNVIRLPFYKPSRDIFAITDVMVLPSEYEGMPLVALEAQAMGTPIVVTDVGNLKEILDVTHGGELVNRIGDVNALRAALVTALQTDYDQKYIRQVVMERFNLQRMYRNYLIALLNNSGPITESDA